MSFEKILSKIKENSALLSLEILPGDPTSRTKAGMVNQAKEQIAALKNDFRDEALRRSLFIVVFGKKAKELSSILQNTFDVKSASPSLLTKKIVDKIEPSLYENRQLHPSVIDIASSVLDTLSGDMGISHVPAIYYDGMKHTVQISDRSDLESLLETLLIEKVGSEIFGINAVMASLDSLIEVGYTAPVLPMVLEVEEKNLTKVVADLNRLTSNVVTVSAGGEAKANLKLGAKAKLDAETVEKLLTEIKNNIKQIL
jgi:hypothetical protein